ncbi:MAG: metallophosphoesterase [Myxococcota bacterium]
MLLCFTQACGAPHPSVEESATPEESSRAEQVLERRASAPAPNRPLPTPADDPNSSSGSIGPSVTETRPLPSLASSSSGGTSSATSAAEGLSPMDTAPVSSSGGSAPSPEDDGPLLFTWVILPDTQLYAQDFPQILTAQTLWIREHAAELGISLVLHEGDVTNHNVQEEWARASDALAILDGVVPYVLTAGNHDLGLDGLAADRTTQLETFFPVSRFLSTTDEAGNPFLGGVFEAGSIQNSYHLLSTGGMDWLVVALEFGPRDSVLRWAGELCQQHPQRQVILLTHSYLDENDRRVDAAVPYSPHFYGLHNTTGEAANDGEQMWRKLVRNHANIRFVFNGHHLGDGAGRLISRGIHGNVVVQLMANYQWRVFGGEGYLRILTFLDGTPRVRVRTYSPWRGSYLTEAQNDFVIDLEAGEFLEP